MLLGTARIEEESTHRVARPVEPGVRRDDPRHVDARIEHVLVRRACRPESAAARGAVEDIGADCPAVLQPALVLVDCQHRRRGGEQPEAAFLELLIL